MQNVLIDAALLIAYDNGMINRYKTEKVFLRETMSVLNGNYSAENLSEVSAELALLTPEQLDDVCTGEAPETDNRVSDLTHMVLNSIFEG